MIILNFRLQMQIYEFAVFLGLFDEVSEQVFSKARVQSDRVAEKKKKRQAIYIAPLQPPTLAAFRPWGGSAGAGRVRPAGCKCRKYLIIRDKNLKINKRFNYVHRFYANPSTSLRVT